MKWIKPFLNWKFLLSFGISWVIMNGWSLIFIWLGLKLNINWMWIAGSTWFGILAMPNGVGIIVSMPLAIFLQTRLYPNDEQLKQQLNELKNSVKRKIK